MAIFPCDLCKKRYPGKSNSVYLGWVAGGYSDRRKLNLCQLHVESVEQWLRKNLSLIEVGGVLQTDDSEISGTCESCRLEPTTQTWFANTFVRSADPAVWAIGLCEKCGDRVLQNAPQAS